MTEPSAAHGRRRAEAPAGHGIDEVLAAARRGVDRVEPADLAAAQAAGAHVIDIRSAVTRGPEGHVPGAAVVGSVVPASERNPSITR